MKQVFKFIIDSRKAFIRLVDELSDEELNEIPAGFNNNIIWNFGHIVTTTPVLCYVRTGVNTDTSGIKYLESYKKGSKPTYTVSHDEIQELKELAVSTIEQLEQDYNNGLFNNMKPFDTTTFGTIINDIEELIATTSGHDNLHYGCAMAQKRLINKEQG